MSQASPEGSQDGMFNVIEDPEEHMIFKNPNLYPSYPPLDKRMLQFVEESLSVLSYCHQPSEMQEFYSQVVEVFSTVEQISAFLLIFCFYVRIAVFCSFMGNAQEAFKWCKKAEKVSRNLDEDERKREEVQHNLIRLCNMFGDFCVRTQAPHRSKKQKQVMKKRIRKASKYLKTGQALIDSLNSRGDEIKQSFKERSQAWIEIDKAQLLRRKQKYSSREAIEGFNKGLEVFIKQRIGNGTLVEICLKKMKKLKIPILRQGTIEAINFIQETPGEEKACVKQKMRERLDYLTSTAEESRVFMENDNLYDKLNLNTQRSI